MVQMQGSYPTEMSFYTLNTDSSEGRSRDEKSCWILAKYDREDTLQYFGISIPSHVSSRDDLSAIPVEVQSAFASPPPEILNWNLQFEFVGIDRPLTLLVSRISIQNGNATEILPCQFFYFPREKAAAGRDAGTNPNPLSSSFELKSLNSPAGTAYLLAGRWYWNEGTKLFRTKCLERCPSVGAYSKETNEVGSAALVNPTGHVGIVALDQHQRKGLSLQCLTKLVGFLAEQTTLIPCSMVHLRNEASMGLHVKAGHVGTHICDFVFHNKN